jgi:hypothetical protein
MIQIGEEFFLTFYTMIRELWPIKRLSFDVINTEVLQCTPIVRYLGAIGEE